MLQIAVVLMGIWLTVSYGVLNERKQVGQLETLKGDVAATNFLAYREAVVAYRNANPAASGTVADASLTWVPGYIRDVRWSNVITGGVLYVYSSGAPAPRMVDAVYQKAGRYVMVGVKNASGNLVSPSGETISTSLPAAITSGAIVFVGG